MRVFEVSKPLIFRDYLKVLTTIREDHDLDFTEKGLTVYSMDPSHVGMVKLELPREYFDKWGVHEPFKINLDIEELNRVLKRMNKGDSMMHFDYSYTLKLTETATDSEGNTTDLQEKKVDEKATFTLVSDIRRSKTVPVLEVFDEEIPTPKIYFKSKTRIILNTLKRIVEDFAVNAQHFTIETTHNEIRFGSVSDYAKESTPLGDENQNILEHHVEESSKATYTISQILPFLKAACKVSEVATLEFSNDMPLKLDVELPQGLMFFYLAPCIGV